MPSSRQNADQLGDLLDQICGGETPWNDENQIDS